MLGAANDGGISRRRLDAGVHLRPTIAFQSHAQSHRVHVDTLRRDLELAFPGDGPPLRRPDRYFGPISFERRVLLITKEVAEARKELGEPLVELGRRRARDRRGWAIGGEEDASAEPYNLLGLAGDGHGPEAEREDDYQEPCEDIAQTFVASHHTSTPPVASLLNGRLIEDSTNMVYDDDDHVGIRPHKRPAFVTRSRSLSERSTIGSPRACREVRSESRGSLTVGVMCPCSRWCLRNVLSSAATFMGTPRL